MKTSIPVIMSAVLAALCGTASAGQIVVAEPVRNYGQAGLSMPTAVAVSSDGRVFVADGVNDRVVVFDSNGQVIDTLRRAAGRRLSNPSAVAVGRDSLFVADTGNRRVVAIQLVGGGAVDVPLDPAWAGSIDLTGVAVNDKETMLWLVDNDHHRVLRGDLKSGKWTVIGEGGESMGQLRNPGMVSLTDKGDAFVSDTLNGRLHGFTRSGRPIRPIARYGVNPGSVYRPRGVAARDGQVWVTDLTGAVQVFTETGALVDVVRSPNGLVLKFDMPAGIALMDDRVYVVELGANRVREFRITTAEGDPYRLVRPSAIGQGAEGKECTLCHLELVPELVGGGSTPLVSAPPDSPDNPYVSTERACLSCHDGTVLDSRATVWTRHGHPVDVSPPEGMAVPPELPLRDGQITCRTCHSAHTIGGAGTQHRDALMLRVTREPDELCVICHGDMRGGK